MRGRAIPDSGFERFYESEAERVFSAVFLLCRNRAVAEDATQEAFARAFERWERLAPVPWAGGWVTTTALNVARRALRRRILHPAVEQNTGTEAALDLWAAVARLPHRQQEAVLLHYRMGTPIGETAEVMGCQAGTVRTHLSRARDALRQELEENEDHGS